MIHLALHFLVPLAAALAFYRPRWRSALVILLATMVVDVDHLLASPVYDAGRCSIGFHPLHTLPAIAAYALLFAVPLALKWRAPAVTLRAGPRAAHLAGLGLLIHMALDGADCLDSWPDA